MKNTLKIGYIFLAGIGIFFVNNIYVLLAVIAVHLVLFFTIKNDQKNFNFLYKVRWFVLLILLFDAFTGPNDFDLIKIKKWTLSLSYEGMLNGAIMSCKLISMLFITQVVRLSMKGKDFVNGMTGLGLSRSSAEIIDEIIVILADEKGREKSPEKGKGNGGGGGGGKGRNQEKQASEIEVQETEEQTVQSKDVLFRGKIGSIPKKLLARISFAKSKFENNPNAVIASASLAVTLIRMVKIAPGLPLAPGHKNILFIPVFIQGITKSDKKFAGTQIGFISGILHFSLGFGKYGPLGIFEFVTLGLVFDLLLKLPVNHSKLWFLMLIGGIGGLIRISTEMLIALILGLPDTFYLIYIPYVISQIAFGAASGFISKAIINSKDE